jgi:hypothetical protein
MTTTEAPPPMEPTPTRVPSAFARAENTSRRILLVICAGTLAWGVGSLLRVDLQERFAESLDGLQTGLAVLVTYWGLHRLWFVVTLGPISWLGGRFIGGSALGFVLPAIFTGEALDLAVGFLRDGYPFESADDFVAWGLSLVLFAVVPMLSHGAGVRAFEKAQQRSLADAAARKAEYDAFIARAQAGGAAPESPASPDAANVRPEPPP